MKSNFEYFYTTTVMASIDIEDIGNCAIEACNDEGLLYYIVIDTSLGSSRIFTYGPCAPDFDILPKSVNCSFKRIIYDERKIGKAIDTFLNDKYSVITSAREIDKEEALNNCRSLIEYMKQSTLY